MFSLVEIRHQMLRPVDQFFEKKEEPTKGCLEFLRTYLLGLDDAITESLKYGMPFYCYHGKMFCYLWVHKKYKKPYIGFVDGNKLTHPDLLQEKRARMKILLIDPDGELPVRKLDTIFRQTLKLYK